MKKYFLLPLIVFLTIGAVVGQSKSNDAIAKQIKDLKAEKTITLSYDEASNMSKIMVTGENFAGDDAKRAGVEAINFGMAFFYQGKALTAAPEEINFTFWVLTKKPKFAAAHRWRWEEFEGIDFGDARYVSKPKENMEYLNFKISLDKLVKAAGRKFKLGDAELKFTPEQIKTFANLLKIINS